jgi:sarcosine oxidase subunit gamma
VGTVASGRITVLCVGPTDWLVLSANPDDKALFLGLEDAFSGTSFRAHDESCALARMFVSGAHARALLVKGCSLDLHAGEFTPGSTARTRFADMPIIVRCLEPDAFELIVTSSYGEYLHAWLTDAALDIACATA